MPATRTAEQKIALLCEIYDYVFDGVESFEQENIGADLAYLMGAILRDTFCTWPATASLVKMLRECRHTPVRAALEYIHVEE